MLKPIDGVLANLDLTKLLILIVLSNKRYGEEVVSDYNTAFNE